MHRAHIDDRAALAARIHMLDGGLGGEEGAVQMDGQHLLPVGERVLFDRRNDLDARIRHQHIDAAQFFHRALDAAIHGFFIGHIHRHGQCLAALGDDAARHLLRILEIQIGDHYGGAEARELARALFANTACCARHERDFVRQ